MAETSVYLNVSNAERTIGFYEGLGFKVSDREEADNGHVMWAGLELDGARIGIGEIAANDDPEFQAWIKGGPLGTGVLVNIVMDDISAVNENAKAMGAEFDQEYSEHEMGASFILTDPDGYSIMFWQPGEE